MDVSAQLKLKFDTVDGELRSLSSQLESLQPFLSFLQQKFQAEFKEFVGATEQVDIPGCKASGDEDTAAVPTASVSAVLCSPTSAETAETYRLQRNEVTVSSTESISVVVPSEDVNSARPVASSTLPLISSPVSINAGAGRAGTHFSSTGMQDNEGQQSQRNINGGVYEEFEEEKFQQHEIVVPVEPEFCYKKFVKAMGLSNNDAESDGASNMESTDSRNSGGSNSSSKATPKTTIASSSSPQSNDPRKKLQKKKQMNEGGEGQLSNRTMKFGKRLSGTTQQERIFTRANAKRQLLNRNLEKAEESDQKDADSSASGGTSADSSSSEDSLYSHPSSLQTPPAPRTPETTKSTGETPNVTIPSSTPSSKCLKKNEVDKDWERKLSQRLCPKKLRIPLKRLPDSIQSQRVSTAEDSGERQKESNFEQAGESGEDEDSLSSEGTSVNSSPSKSSTELDCDTTRSKDPPLQTRKTRKTRLEKKEKPREAKCESSKRRSDLRCSTCKKTFKTVENLFRHERTHNPRKKMKCPMCLKSFLSKCDLERHERIHRNERPHKCSACRRAFTQASNLRRHEMIHRNEMPFRCSFCSKSFRVKSSLLSHNCIHSYERRFKCSLCPKAFHSVAGVTRHKSKSSHQ